MRHEICILIALHAHLDEGHVLSQNIGLLFVGQGGYDLLYDFLQIVTTYGLGLRFNNDLEQIVKDLHNRQIVHKVQVEVVEWKLGKVEGIRQVIYDFQNVLDNLAVAEWEFQHRVE